MYYNFNSVRLHMYNIYYMIVEYIQQIGPRQPENLELSREWELDSEPMAECCVRIV